MNLQVEFCGIPLKNPVIAASTDMSRTQERFLELVQSGVGAIITKSVTDAAALQQKSIARFDIRDSRQRPIQGDIPEDYTFFSRGGSMVSMEQFRAYGPEQLREAQAHGVVLIGSISAAKKANWVSYAREMESMGFPMLELNFGNPHGEAADGKLGFLLGQSEELCCDIVSAVLSQVTIPVIVKLTPQVADMTAIVKALASIGAKAVTVMHRYQGLVVDLETEEPVLGGFAAIGGTWMKPVSLANIAKIYRQVKEVAICGGNGADNGRDVAEYMMCGASVVQIGSTLMLRGPEAVTAILSELEEILDSKGLTTPQQLTGRTAQKIVTYKNLSELPQRESQMDLEQCSTCEDKRCVIRCYFGALSDKAGQLAKDDQLCTGCGMCFHICPKEAVKMVSWKEGEEK